MLLMVMVVVMMMLMMMMASVRKKYANFCLTFSIYFLKSHLLKVVIMITFGYIDRNGVFGIR